MSNHNSTQATSRNWRAGVAQACVHLAAIVVLTGIFAVIVPRIMRAFEEFDLALPAPTVLMMHLSTFLVERWIVAIPLLLALIACDVVVLLGLRAIPWCGNALGTIWFALILIGLGLFVVLTMFAILMPMYGLADGLAR